MLHLWNLAGQQTIVHISVIISLNIIPEKKHNSFLYNTENSDHYDMEISHK